MLETTRRERRPKKDNIYEFSIGFKDEEIEDPKTILNIIDKTKSYVEEISDTWNFPIKVVDLSENCEHLYFKIKLFIQLTPLNRANMLKTGADGYIDAIVEEYSRLYNRKFA